MIQAPRSLLFSKKVAILISTSLAMRSAHFCILVKTSKDLCLLIHRLLANSARYAWLRELIQVAFSRRGKPSNHVFPEKRIA